MNVSANGQEFIDAFFNALRLRDIEKSEAALAQLAHLADKSPQWRAWHQYLSGILVFERDRDFAEAERVFLGLLDGELDPTMRGRVLRALGRSVFGHEVKVKLNGIIHKPGQIANDQIDAQYAPGIGLFGMAQNDIQDTLCNR